MEIWKQIKGYENIYDISNKANVFSYTSNKKLKPQLDKDGYLILNLYKNKKGKTFKIHRLVCESFKINLHKKKEVNHINGIKSDNNINNLEWCTRSENVNHALTIGLKVPNRGEDLKFSKLTEKKVKEILTKKLNSNGKRYWGSKDLAKKFNIQQLKNIIFLR